MSARAPESILLEAEYLRLATEDLRAMHDAIADAAGALAPIHVELLALMIGGGADQLEAATRASKMAGETMQQIAAAQDALCRLTDLTVGRAIACDREATRDDDDAAGGES